MKIGQRLTLSYLNIVLLILGMAFIQACSSKSLTPSPQLKEISPGLRSFAPNAKDLVTINSLLVMPVNLNSAGVVRDPQSLKPAPRFMDVQLLETAKRSLNFEIAEFPTTGQPGAKSTDSNSKKVEGLGSTAGKDTIREALAYGKKKAVDAVLVTSINQFTERQGSRVGVLEPAQVSFSMHLLRVSDGHEVWNASYHYKDQALSDNLFKIKDKLEDHSGPGWRKAEDVLVSGYAKALQSLSDIRLSEFTTSQAG